MLDPNTLKEALLGAGFEVYRATASEIQIAERVRLHIMDSGVRVLASEPLMIRFTARSQRSDSPHLDRDALFARVRDEVGGGASERGYREAEAATVEVKDPMDEAKILDVWHEITYERSLETLEGLIEELHWAIHVEKYVSA